MKTLSKELFKEIGFIIFLILLIPVMIIDMKIHPKKWDDLFANDPMGDPDDSFYYR